MPPKRPSDAAEPGSSSNANGSGPAAAGNGIKRPRLGESSNAAATSSATPVRPTSATATGGAPNSIQAQIEAAKARAAALMARNNGGLSGNTNTAARPASASSIQAAGPSQARPALPSVVPARPPPSAPHGTAIDMSAIQRQIAEAKRRADELARGRFSSPNRNEEARPPSGIHPLLASQSSLSSAGAGAAASSSGAQYRGPKFSSVSANARNAAASGSTSRFGALSAAAQQSEPQVNPYLSATAGSGEDAQDESGRVRARRRALNFNAPGRHIRAAEEARREAQMEALKKRIEETARKAGLEELTAEERALRRPQPPGVEWWDQVFLPDQENYDQVALLGATGKDKDGAKGPLIVGEGSPIDIYIQHPIPIPAPSDKIKLEPKGVMLTKKEMKKMRKMRRKAEQEDKRDKIKMGLIPPDPAKVKLSNLMRVLTSEAVADPTKVEARVRRDVAARQNLHEQTNLERQLTPEQRKAKLDEQKLKDLQKGVSTLVFKIRHLISPSHKFKVRKNALQNGLTGMALFGKDFALVLVEGGQKGIKSYRHLMTNRINWNDPGRPKAEVGDDLLDLGTPGPSSGSTPGLTAADDDQDELAQIDWTENYCRVLFEGPIRDRNFTHGFKARQCEADIDAKQALGPRLASYWDMAKRESKASEEDDF